MKFSLTSFGIVLGLSLALLWPASTVLAAASLTVNQVRIINPTTLAVTYSVRGLEASTEAKIVLSATATVSGRIITLGTTPAQPVTKTASPQRVEMTINGDQFNRSDSLTVTGKLFDAANGQLITTNQRTLNQQALAEQQERTTLPVLQPVDSRFTVEARNGTRVGILEWEPIEGATQYCYFKTGFEDRRVCVDGAIRQVEIVPGSAQFTWLQDIRQGDSFVVQGVYKDSTGKVQVLTQDEAADRKDVVVASTEFGQVANLGEYADKILKYALPLGMALAVLMTMYAGLTMMNSQGKPDKIKQGQEMIQGAILGLMILIIARFLANFLLLPKTDFSSITNPSQNRTILTP